MKQIIVNDEFDSLRLDKALSLILSDLSRSKIQHFIEDGLVLINQKIAKSSYKLVEGDEISILDFPNEEYHLEAENIPLDIVFEDDDLLVINKAKGMVVHPGSGVYEHTLANALKFHSNELSSINGEFRPGIVHRLDKDTSGLLVVAKNDYAHKFLQDQLKDHSLSRKYYALVKGIISEEEGKIIAPIGRDKKDRKKMAVDLKNGKEAITYFKVLKRYSDATLIECRLQTGRTHQIRVHMNYIDHPVIGDLVYGSGNKTYYKDGQLLFAHEISFIHPRSKKLMTFDAEMPSYFKEVLDKLS